MDDQLFLCLGGQHKGALLTYDRLAHSVKEATVQAYLSIHCTKVPPGWHGSVADICVTCRQVVACSSSSSTLARFYRLNVALSQPMCSVVSLNLVSSLTLNTIQY